MIRLKDIIVLDDCISDSYSRAIEAKLMDRKTPWYFQKDIVVLSNEIGTPGLSHFFYDSEMGGIISPELYNLLLPIVFEASAKIGIKPNGIIQARSFMHFPLADSLRKEYDHIHVDHDREHIVALYYVNDTDGDTIMFDKTTKEVPFGADTRKYQWTIKQRITPKRGRIVFFNGDQYHASSGPTKDMRCIINFNLV